MLVLSLPLPGLEAVGKSGGRPSVGSGSVGMTMVGKGSVGSGKVGSGRPTSGVGVAVGALWVGPDGVWLGLAVGGREEGSGK